MDFPYRCERTVVRLHHGGVVDGFEIQMTGEGVVARGENYMEARRLVDLANAAYAMEKAGTDR